jgi:hypothetical protein
MHPSTQNFDLPIDAQKFMYKLIFSLKKSAYSLLTITLLLTLSVKVWGQTTYTWRGGASSSYATSTNWSPTRTTPATNDILVFDGSNINGSNGTGAVTCIDVPTQTIGRLSLINNATVTLRCPSSASTLTINNTTSGALSVANGSTLITQGRDQTSSVNFTLALSGTGCTAEISGRYRRSFQGSNSAAAFSNFTLGAGTSLNVSATGVWEHNVDAGSIPTGTFASGSTVEITGSPSVCPTATGTYHHVIWNCSGQTADISLAGNFLTINGDFTLQNTGTATNGIGHQTTTTNRTRTIGGNFSVGSNGKYYGTSSASGSPTLNIEGGLTINGSFKSHTSTSTGDAIMTINFTNTNSGNNSSTLKLPTSQDRYQSRWNININSGRTITLGSNIEMGTNNNSTTNRNATFTVSSGGTLNMSTFTIINNGTGSYTSGNEPRFTLASGGSIITANTAGFSSTAATGAVQVTGTKTFNTGANYTYNAALAQATGNALPATVNNLSVNNTGGNVLTLTGSVAVNGTLTLTNGSITTGGNAITYGASGSLCYNGASQQTTAAAEFPTSNGPKTLVINNSSGVILNFPRSLSTGLTLTSGILTTTSTNTLTITSTATNTINRTSGHISGPLDLTLANGNNYFYPVGGNSSNYRPINLNSVVVTSNPVVRVTVAESGASTVDGTSLSSLLSARNWHIQQISGTFTSATLNISESSMTNGTHEIGKSVTQSGNYASCGTPQTVSSGAVTSPSGQGAGYYAIGLKFIPTSTITLASNAPGAASSCAGTTRVILQSFSLAVSVGNGDLTNVGFTTTGTYLQGDVSKYQLWYRATTNDITGATQLGSDLSSIGGAGARTFSAFGSPTLTNGVTYYFWITADVTSGPSGGNISVNGIGTGDLTSGSTKAGSTTSAAGTQTLRSAFTSGAISTNGETFCGSGTPAQISSSIVASGGDGSFTYQWQSSSAADFSANLTTLSSSNSVSFTPTGPVTNTTYYRRQVKDGTCNSFTTSTGSWTITVNQLPASSPAVSHTNTGQTTTNVRFTWTTPADADGVNVYDATSNALLQSGNTSGQYDYTTTANTQVGIKVKAYKGTTSCENASFGTAAYAYSSQNTPTGLAFSSVGQYTITATASGTMANATAGSSGVLITNTTNSETSGWFTTISDPWVNESLLCNTSYTYSVIARNGDGDETASFTPSAQSTSACPAGVTRWLVGTGDWTNTAIWSTTQGGSGGASAPTGGADIVNIDGGHTVTVSANVQCASITFTSTSTLRVNGTLNVTGAVTVSPLASSDNTATIEGSGTISCGSISIGSTTSPGSMAADRTTRLNSTISAFSCTGNLNLNARNNTNDNLPYFSLQSGTFTLDGIITPNVQSSYNQTCTFTMADGSGNATLVLNNSTPWGTDTDFDRATGWGAGTFQPCTYILNLNGSSSTVIYNRLGAQTINRAESVAGYGPVAVTYRNLTLAGSGNKSLPPTSTATIAGTLSIQGTAAMTTTSPTYGASSTLEYKGSSAQTTTSIEFVTGSTGPLNLIIDNASGVTLHAARTLRSGGSANTLTLKSGNLTNSTNNLTINNGANIIRTGGSISSAPVFGTTVNVIYNSHTSSITTGPEIPTSSAVLNNLTINNSNGVTLNTAAMVNNTLDLLSGVLTLGTNNLTIASSGAISGGSSSSFVVTNSTGILKQISINGSSAAGKKVFPIGLSASSYTPMILANTGTSDDFSARVVSGVLQSGTTGTAITSKYVDRTWLIDETVAGGSDATLTLGWNAAEEQGQFNRIACFVTHYTGGAWDVSTATSASGTPYTTFRSGITSFSPFSVTSTSALPIELISFQANCANNKTVDVTWSTATEHNSYYFRVDKSRDGIQWDVLGTIGAAGHSTNVIDYALTDIFPAPGINYYRLTQYDVNGSYEMFDIYVAVCKDQQSGTVLSVFPNPSLGDFNVELQTEELEGEATLMITDAKGAVVHSQDIKVIKGANNYLIQRFEADPGIYYIIVELDGKRFVFKHSAM